MRIQVVFRQSRVRSSSVATFFHGDRSRNKFYSHSLPIADLSRAVVSYWSKDVHKVLVNRLCLRMPRKGVDSLTDHLDMIIVVDWDVKPHSNKQTKPVCHYLKGFQSFRTQVNLYQSHSLLLWSFRTQLLVISYPVTTISYPGCFVPSLVISYLGQMGMKWLYVGQFIPMSFHTHFGHLVSCSNKMNGWVGAWVCRSVHGWVVDGWIKFDF